MGEIYFHAQDHLQRDPREIISFHDELAWELFNNENVQISGSFPNPDEKMKGVVRGLGI